MVGQNKCNSRMLRLKTAARPLRRRHKLSQRPNTLSVGHHQSHDGLLGARSRRYFDDGIVRDFDPPDSWDGGEAADFYFDEANPESNALDKHDAFEWVQRGPSHPQSVEARDLGENK